MKNKKSFKRPRKGNIDSEFREKKIKDPRKNKPEREFSIYDELDEVDPDELLNDFDKFDDDEDIGEP